MKQLNEKVAIVTGAGQGIGKGIALCLAKRSVKVVCTGRREAPIQQTVAEIEELGGQGLAMTCDSADRARVEEVVKAAESAGIRDKVTIMVGGAPLTQAFCDKIGADIYTKDASEAASAAASALAAKSA